MKVYELIDQLSKLPAGLEVRFRRLLSKEELVLYDDEPEFYEVALEIREVALSGDTVDLDGWVQ